MITVKCKAERTGLLPFIDQAGEFESARAAIRYFDSELNRYLEDGNLEWGLTKATKYGFEFDIIYQNGKVCGSGIIEEVKK